MQHAVVNLFIGTSMAIEQQNIALFYAISISDFVVAVARRRVASNAVVIQNIVFFQWQDTGRKVSKWQSRVLGVYRIPSRVESLGERRKQGLGWSPDRKQFLEFGRNFVRC